MAAEPGKSMEGGPLEQQDFGVGPLRPHDPFVSHSHSQSWRERQEMLKCCVKPLITLVLVLLATGALSSLSHARANRTPEGAAVSRAVNSAPRPGVTSGEPDSPSAPPPVRLNGGVQQAPRDPSVANAGVDIWVVFRWTGEVWARWFEMATF